MPFLLPSGRTIVPIAHQYESTFSDMDSLQNRWNVVSLDQWSKSYLEKRFFWGRSQIQKRFLQESRNTPDISSPALVLFALLFSNASVERIFSQMNVVHTELRNRVSVRSVEAILQTRSVREMLCVTFKPTEGMVKNFNAKGCIERDGDNADARCRIKRNTIVFIPR